MNKKDFEEMKKVYHEFGIDIHEVSRSLQPQVNRLVKEVIKLRNKRKKRN